MAFFFFFFSWQHFTPPPAPPPVWVELQRRVSRGRHEQRNNDDEESAIELAVVKQGTSVHNSRTQNHRGPNPGGLRPRPRGEDADGDAGEDAGEVKTL